MQPKEITIDVDTKQETASFDYSIGIAEAKERGLKQTTSFADVFAGTHFIVCCGDVMFSVRSSEYPDVVRREF